VNLIDIETNVNLNLVNPLWYLLGFIALIVLLLLALFFYKRGKKKYRFKLTPKELAKERVKNIDYTDAKSVAYIFGEDVALFVDDKNRQKYKELEQKLAEYKYKKDVPELDKSLEKEIKDFIRGIRWGI